MAVGTEFRRAGAPTRTKRSKGRSWIVAAAIAVAMTSGGIGTLLAVTGSDGSPAGTPAVSSRIVTYVDPGVDARQEALKRFHEDARPNATGSSFEDALKRYHQDAKG